MKEKLLYSGRVETISLMLLFLGSSKKNPYHQAQLNDNFRLNLTIVFILSSFDVVFFSI